MKTKDFFQRIARKGDRGVLLYSKFGAGVSEAGKRGGFWYTVPGVSEIAIAFVFMEL